MAFYSSNRLSNLGTTKVAANESYVGSAGLGRLMVESEQNDMAIFEAVLAHDFSEARGIHEGTILESEIRSLNEGSIKEFFTTLKAKLMKFWEKIKGVFKTVYAKLTEWIVRSGKAFVNLHRKELTTKDFSKFPGMAYRPNVKNPTEAYTNRPDKWMTASNVRTQTNFTPDDAEFGRDSKFMTKQLSKILGGKATTASSFSKDFLDFCYAEENKKFKPSGSEITKMMDNVYNGKAPIKELRDLEKKDGNKIRDVLKDLDTQKANLEKDDEAAGKALTTARNYCAAFETVVSLYTSSAIKIVKFGLSQDRKALGKLVAYNPRSVSESALLMEEADFEADSDLEALVDDSEAEVPTEEFPAELEDVEGDLGVDDEGDDD